MMSRLQNIGALRSVRRRPIAAPGFTLVEAMVALVVLSVGMIGVAALHGQSLSAARSAYFRSIAVTLTADMADRIRGNRLAGAAYAGAATNHRCDPSTGGGIDCTPAEMAAHDLYLWNATVQRSLPNGRWNVAFDPDTTPPTYTITVLWDEVGAPVNPVRHQIALQLPSF
jgi:type IV pilus assembly protein PilV